MELTKEELANLKLNNDEEIRLITKPELKPYILRNIMLYIILTLIFWIIGIIPLIYSIIHNEISFGLISFVLGFIIIPVLIAITMYFIFKTNLNKIKYIITNKNLIHINNKGRILKIGLSLINDINKKSSPFTKDLNINDYYIDTAKEPVILYGVLYDDLESLLK